MKILPWPEGKPTTCRANLKLSRFESFKEHRGPLPALLSLAAQHNEFPAQLCCAKARTRARELMSELRGAQSAELGHAVHCHTAGVSHRQAGVEHHGHTCNMPPRRRAACASQACKVTGLHRSFLPGKAHVDAQLAAALTLGAPAHAPAHAQLRRATELTTAHGIIPTTGSVSVS